MIRTLSSLFMAMTLLSACGENAATRRCNIKGAEDAFRRQLALSVLNDIIRSDNINTTGQAYLDANPDCCQADKAKKDMLDRVFLAPQYGYNVNIAFRYEASTMIHGVSGYANTCGEVLEEWGDVETADGPTPKKDCRVRGAEWPYGLCRPDPVSLQIAKALRKARLSQLPCERDPGRYGPCGSDKEDRQKAYRRPP